MPLISKGVNNMGGDESSFSKVDDFLLKLADQLGDDVLKLGIAINTVR